MRARLGRMSDPKGSIRTSPDGGGGAAIALQPFLATHLALLEGWLRRPHVAPWYPDRERDLALASAPPANGSHAVIAEAGRPVGYLRWQHVDRSTLDELGLREIPEGSVDIDVLIGEPSNTGRGIGPQALDLLAARFLPDPGVAVLGLTTSVENVRAHRAFRRAGFEFSRQYDPNGFGLCHLMIRDLRAERTRAPRLEGG